MAYAIHLICRPGIGGGWPENVTHDRSTKLFSSGYWDLAAQDAEALIGGWLYLHATKAEPSYYGGQVQAYEFVTRTDVAHTNRIALKFRVSAAAKLQKWRGHGHARAWTSGLVVADFPHEVTSA